MGNHITIYNSCRQFWFITLIINAFFSSPSYAQEQILLAYQRPLAFNGLYQFTYNAIPFGKLAVTIDHQSEHYKVMSDVTTTGLVKLIVPHQSHTQVEGTGANFIFSDVIYESRYQTRKKKKYVKMVYKDGLPVETKIPPDNPLTRPPVSNEDKQDAADPLSFILRIRESIHDAYLHGQEHFQLKFYDGRRLTLIKVSMEGTKTIRYQGKKQQAIRVGLTRELIAGFTEKERGKYSKDEPVIYVHFSNDGRLIPLEFQTYLWFGSLRAKLIKECTDSGTCLFRKTDK